VRTIILHFDYNKDFEKGIKVETSEELINEIYNLKKYLNL
jgi:hypothetical protein